MTLSFLRTLFNKKESSSRIWVISDDSHRAIQASTVASYLDPEFLMISVGDLKFSGGLKRYLKNKLEGNIIWPRIVIGAGEETNEYLKETKYSSGGETISICILDPRSDYDKFDLVVIPSHEPHPIKDNIIETTGIINRITPELIKEALEDIKRGKYRDVLVSKPIHPITTVLMGGKAVGDYFSPELAEKLAKILLEQQREEKNIIFATTSPRTSKEAADIFFKILSAESDNFIFYNWKENRNVPNPYLPMLALADHIIVTGDSVRMCSEACSLGKKVSIFPCQEDSHYTSLHKKLIEGSYADLFSINKKIPPQIPPLSNEGKRVAEYISELFL